jgi:hypothetical protein
MVGVKERKLEVIFLLRAHSYIRDVPLTLLDEPRLVARCKSTPPESQRHDLAKL